MSLKFQLSHPVSDREVERQHLLKTFLGGKPVRYYYQIYLNENQASLAGLIDLGPLNSELEPDQPGTRPWDQIIFISIIF